MIYLGLAIICSCSIGLLFKFSETRGLHRYSVTTVNYITASATALVMSGAVGTLSRLDSISATGLPGRLVAITLGGGTLPAGNSLLWALLVGINTGFFFLYAFIYYQKSISENGVALSGMFSRLGILIPMAVSIVIWREYPSSLQNVGIILAIAVIVLVNVDLQNRGWPKPNATLLLVFVTTGMGIFSNKIFQKYALLEHKSLFLLFAYSTALLFSLRVSFRERQAVELPDILIGVLVGVINLTTNYFIIIALSRIKAAVVFPILSAGTIICITLGGVLIFGEKLRRRDIFAFCMTIIAVILINS